MSRKIMKHLNSSKLINEEHTAICSIRKDNFPSWKKRGFQIIEEGDDVYLIGKPIEPIPVEQNDRLVE